jgi:2-polyprenyl-6-methoxyphenol hydroxylase-like FAD-dependent oxidoreductase
MRVIIVGAGIGGLVAALMLHERGIEVEVLESVSEPKALGVGINVLPHATAVLARLGLLDELVTLGVSTAELCYFNRYGQLIWREPRGLSAGYLVPQLSIHRGRLQLALLDIVRREVGQSSLLLGQRLESFTQSGSTVHATVQDRVRGETAHLIGDVLIGADGIHSTVRRTFYPHEGYPCWSGELLWRATSEIPSFLSGQSMVMIGSRRRKFVAYPISAPNSAGLATVNWIATVERPGRAAPEIQDWNRPGQLEDFLPGYLDWTYDWLDVPRTVRAADGTYEFPMVDRDPLPRWSFGRVSLLGDAAHPMYPIGSNGASQAILDAQALAEALATEADAEAALRRYDETRRLATSAIVHANRRHGPARILDIAELRAPEGFRTITDVFGPGEIEQIATGYKRLAGFDQAQVRTS